jgi:hypothetical protein
VNFHDIELSEHLSKITETARNLNKLTRDKDENGLWKAVATILDHGDATIKRMLKLAHEK